MKPARNNDYYFSSFSSTVTYSFCNDDQIAPTHRTLQVPISNPQSEDSAAAKIQSSYRAHRIRKLYRTISSVNSEADELQRQIQRQETVDALRSSERERLRMNEALMRLLLRLDSVPGVDPAVREARRKVSRRIVGLQEILDGVCGSKLVGEWEWDAASGGGLMMINGWDGMLEEMEEKVCRERGGDEMERFCAQYLGFRCFQRFLCDP
ncbi:hypothetical protein K2173_009869 [Erythroxylum novogranatense]|uniref:BAG domain-containing protein n=1 Tax=Erythroxylum novogranatense TaxID=1862640 RepID=A0AAV8T0E1_9ROSI|nr:hypothetical protein K2173_009869 [Erythroxylum novogranatense]